MTEVDTTKVILVTSIIAALAAVLAAGLTSIAQLWVASRERKASRADAQSDRKRDLYYRYLKFFSHPHVEIWDAVVAGDQDHSMAQRVARELADFRAELLLYGSPAVREVGPSLGHPIGRSSIVTPNWALSTSPSCGINARGSQPRCGRPSTRSCFLSWSGSRAS